MAVKVECDEIIKCCANCSYLIKPMTEFEEKHWFVKYSCGHMSNNDKTLGRRLELPKSEDQLIHCVCDRWSLRLIETFEDFNVQTS